MEEVAVVAHENQRAVVFQEGLFEDFLAADVEVVGGLVEDEERIWLKEEFCHLQSRTLAAGEHFYFLLDVFAAKKERAENVAYFGAHIARCNVVKCLKNSLVQVEKFVLILSIITDGDVVTEFQFAVVWQLTDDAAREGGFALAVASHECHFFAAFELKINVFQYDFFAKCLGKMRCLHHNLT